MFVCRLLKYSVSATLAAAQSWSVAILEAIMMIIKKTIANTMNIIFLFVAEKFSVRLLARITQEREKPPIEIAKDAKQTLKQIS